MSLEEVAKQVENRLNKLELNQDLMKDRLNVLIALASGILIIIIGKSL
jgi:hypothetical protein